ncbi:MAG: 16S rRNA (uracil(1498)-N(3))-methyltransferase [Rhodoferax sp.]
MLDLPAPVVRHVQVLRLQPGARIRLFDGRADTPWGLAEFEATIVTMGRASVRVQLGRALPATGDPALQVTLAVGMPANDRMDWLIEKAAELGAWAVQPLLTERSVLRLSGERAVKKQAHWQAIAQAAAEQSGACRVTVVQPVRPLRDWLADASAWAGAHRWVLALDSSPTGANGPAQATGPRVCLSGPEGGLSPAELQAALDQGFVPWCLGPRVLRAETAPLVALARCLA